MTAIFKKTTNRNQLIFLGVEIGWITNDRKKLILNSISYSSLHILKAFAEIHHIDSVSCLRIDEENIKTSRFFPRLGLNDFQLPFVIKYEGWKISFSDLWFSTDYSLKISLEGMLPHNETVIINYYQYDFSQGVLVKVAKNNISNTDFYISDVSLLNPLLPLLMVMMDSEGQFLTSSFLPFPSLFRGGMHYSEVYTLTDGELCIDSIFSYSSSLLLSLLSNRLSSDGFLVSKVNIIDEVKGDEKIFNPYFSEWLVNIFKVRLLSKGLSSFIDDFYEASINKNIENIRKENGSLSLKGDFIPTIAVLVERNMAIPVSSFIVANFIDHMPKASITMPIDNKCSLFKEGQFPIYQKNENILNYNANFPIAIKFYREEGYSPSSKIYPLAPDRREISNDVFSIDIVVTISFDDDLSSFETLLHTLSTQSNIKINKIIVIVKEKSGLIPKKIELLLKSKFLDDNMFFVPKRMVFMKDMLSCCMQYTEKELVLFIKDTILLHDQYTLKNLCEIASNNYYLATVSCQSVAEIKNNVFEYIYSGFLSKDIEGTTMSVSSQLVCKLGLFEKTAYPVLANNFDCTLVKKTALENFNYISPNVKAPIFLDDSAYLDFGLKMIEEGYQNFCTGKSVVINTSKKTLFPDVSLNLSTSRLAAIMGRLILINNFKS